MNKKIILSIILAAIFVGTGLAYNKGAFDDYLGQKKWQKELDIVLGNKFSKKESPITINTEKKFMHGDYSGNDNNHIEVLIDDYLKEKLPSNLRVKGYLEGIEPSSDDFVIVSSILSNNKNKVVYSEISKSVSEYGENGCGVAFKFNIFLKDLKSGSIEKIFYYPGGGRLGFNFFIKTAHAGGGPLVYIPFAWSKNDKKILLDVINPARCGGGGMPHFKTYSIDVASKQSKGVATYDSKFIDNYSAVVYVDESNKTINFCGPASQANLGKIVLKYIENGEKRTLKEEPNSYYKIEEVKNGNVIYSRSDMFKKNNSIECGDLDGRTTVRGHMIKI
jgi:hypothetical protein